MTRHLTYPLVTKIKSISTRAADDVAPNCVEVEVQTPLGRGVLHLSRQAAFDLGSRLATHLQPRQPDGPPTGAGGDGG